MSYCRWSTNDFQCDLYVYEDVNGGWTTHIAGNRVIYTEPLPEPIELAEDGVEGWMARQKRIYEMLDAAKREYIDLPHAGETLSDPTPLACAERLEYLRDLGYRVPQSAIDRLREEAT